MTHPPPNPFNALKLKNKHVQIHDHSFTAKEARELLGMTQKALARSLGISLRTWQKYESGSTPLKPYLYLALRQLILTSSTRLKNTTAISIQLRMRQLRANAKQKLNEYKAKKLI